MLLRCLLAAFAGLCTVAAFAPVGIAALPVFTLGVLFMLWEHAGSLRERAWLGFAYGLGLFGAGVSWVSIALSTFGGMALPLSVVSTAGFCAFLALFPAVAGALVGLGARHGVPVWVLAPAAWTITEWARSWFLSGFPWLSIGYSQVPDGWFSGFLPVIGVFGVTLVVAGLAAIAGALLAGIGHRISNPGQAGSAPGSMVIPSVLAFALIATAPLLGRIEWTRAISSLPVSLVQGNVSQDMKFDPKFRERTLDLYRQLVERTRGRLVVLPESALPMFAHEVPPEFATFLEARAKAGGGDLLFGIFIFDPRDGGHYHNSVISVGQSGAQAYRKRHLVPFGETIPLKSVVGWFINEILHIPLADQTPGPRDQPLLEAAGERIAISICYEDAFGVEVLDSLPGATLLVNVSNDAWYGRSNAAAQHDQIARARAIETGRMMLRATQTGITAIIDHRGGDRGHLEWFRQGILEGEAQGRAGATPYVRVGDWGAVGLAAGLAVWGVLRRRRGV